jgi:hypothetical protein
MTTAADELRAAAQTLLDLADETDADIETNPYWHSQIAPRAQWFAHGVENGLGGPSGKLAGLLSPETAHALAAWLRTAADYVADDSPTHPTHVVRALAVARQISRSRT